MIPAKTINWHLRYQQQARWTAQVRKFAAASLQLEKAHRLLEVGCGTGAILADLAGQTQGSLFGLDINPSHLVQAAGNAPQSELAAGDALRLPFAARIFDAVVCHYFLLWVSDPGGAVREMVRVTRSGGAVAMLAEPDYGGRIDYPPDLARLAEWQIASLRVQGADPATGRRVCSLLHSAGLKNIQSGVLGGHWSAPLSDEEWELEWATLAADLAYLAANETPPAEIERLREMDHQAWQSGERVLFVPTFFAWGIVA